MNETEITWKQLVRYLSGEASLEERLRVEKWIDSNYRNKELFSELEQIWNSSVEDKQHWNSKESWLRYKASYGFAGDYEDAKLSHISKVGNTKSIPSQTYNWQTWTIAVSAIFAIVLVSIVVYQVQEKDAVAEPMEKFVTKTGQQMTLHFNDGTNVQLNAESILKVPKVFGDTLREVWLRGEAYFDVAHNPDKPFIVHTAHARTRVLGTLFDVQAYSEDSQVQVVVAKGLVSLKANHQNSDNLISKRQKGILTKDGNVNISTVSNMASYIGWRKGKLIFSNEPFGEVVSRLKRWYDIDIDFDKALSNRRLTAQFTIHQPLSQVLDAIALTLDINYARQDSTIAFN